MKHKQDESLEFHLLEVKNEKSIGIEWLFNISYLCLRVQEQLQRIFTLKVLFFSIALTYFANGRLRISAGIILPNNEFLLGGEIGFQQ